MNTPKVDLVMWTKNGAKTLPYVLLQIKRVVPEDFVNKKFIVDDASSDDTRLLANEFGWAVYSNDGQGVSDGANTALRHLESEFFASFEQDILLSPYWWPNVPEMLFEKETAVASGVRFPTEPLALRNLLEHDLEQYEKSLEDSDPFHYGKTLDNTIYRTEIIRKIGGFPKLPPHLSASVDTVLAKRIMDAGFKWKVNYKAKSLHMRTGLRDELRHFYWYGTQNPFLMAYIAGKQTNTTEFLKTFLYSPKIGMDLALKLNSPQLIYIYPMIQLSLCKGLVSATKKNYMRESVVPLHSQSPVKR
jgi:glycosyltransferase involved in cell wall biosynthesis